MSTAPERPSAVDAKVAAATIDLLRAGGPGAVTIENVAARSGVAKTTIYRRYADRNELLRRILDETLPPLVSLDRSDPRAALVTAARMLSETVENCVGFAVAAIVTRQDDPASETVRRRVIQPRLDALADLLRDCADEGTVRADIDVDLVLGMIVGSVGSTYVRFGTFGADWPERLVDHLWRGIEPRRDPGGLGVWSRASASPSSSTMASLN